jgi:hypothetical protein
VLNVTDGTKPLRSLFSKEQLAFYDEHAPAGVDMDSLLAQGPIFLLKAKHQPKEFERGITVEMWLWNDGRHILEISAKCAPAEAFQAGIEFKAYLAPCLFRRTWCAYRRCGDRPRSLRRSSSHRGCRSYRRQPASRSPCSRWPR